MLIKLLREIVSKFMSVSSGSCSKVTDLHSVNFFPKLYFVYLCVSHSTHGIMRSFISSKQSSISENI